MSTTIKVKINLDGVTARETNEIGEEPNRYYSYSTPFGTEYKESSGWREWQEAESKLRTFTIEGRNGFTNSIHNAEIIDYDKLIIRIL